ncbi:HNH endonuclease [Simplicispira lacusdiani]|uniref:HNH endonuclease n=1 Tax=Simplicispira lacusdiani TaxID=2213010 RepID=UPI000E710D99
MELPVFKLSHLRQSAYLSQQGRCWYCGCKLLSPKFHLGGGVTIPHPRSCTAEHLQARKDGGADIPANVVAACRHCNEARHSSFDGIAPSRYRQKVRQAVAVGKWPTQRRAAAGR